MIVEYIKTSIIYTTFFMILLLTFGAMFSFVEKRNSSSVYASFGFNGLLVTGLVGTIVHEFSHMVFCLIFRHRITEFSLFRPFKSRYDGIMGYVNHSCNINSKYQRAGNFFIGVAPIIFGTIFIILCMWILLPNEFNSIKETFNINMSYMNNINYVKDTINIYVSIVLAIIQSLNPFRRHNFLSYLIFIYLMYSVTTHMDLSKEDLSNSTFGLVVFVIFIFLINLIFCILGLKYQVILLKLFISSISFLTVGLLFAIFTLVISKIMEFFIL